jgi:hypothetical protein
VTRYARCLLIAAILTLPLPGTAYGQGKPSSASVTVEFLIGRWGDNGDCTKDVVLRADGTFTSYTGGEGRWSLRGDRLVFTGANGEFVMRVERDSDNVLVITNPDGSVGRSQRC